MGIRERQTLMKKRGPTCYEAIHKGNQIRKQLEELKGHLPKLQELQKKAQGRWTNKMTDEESQDRYKVIRLLNRQVNEANDLFLSSNSGIDISVMQAEGGTNPTASLLGLRHAAAEEDCTRLLTAQEKDGIDKIRQRDKELDKQVEEIGQVVDRAGEIAKQIGFTAERQKLKAENIGTDVEKADKDIQELNKKVKAVMKYEKNTNFCCQMVLVITLLCCVGFIFQQLQ